MKEDCIYFQQFSASPCRFPMIFHSVGLQIPVTNFPTFQDFPQIVYVANFLCTQFLRTFLYNVVKSRKVEVDTTTFPGRLTLETLSQ